MGQNGRNQSTPQYMALPENSLPADFIVNHSISMYFPQNGYLMAKKTKEKNMFHPLPSGTMQLPLKILRFQATLVVGAKQETTEQQLSLPRSSSLRQITGLHGTTSFWIMLGLLCYNTSPLCPLHITIYGNFSVENRHSLLVQIAASAKQRNMTKSPLDEEHQTLDTSKFEHCVLFCSS